MSISIKRRFKVLMVLRWLARLLGVLSIIVLVLFLTGEGFAASRISFEQWIGFLFFPFGVVAGFIVGWKKEILGGFISLLSLFCFYVIYGLLISGRLPAGWGFAILTLPAAFYLAAGIYAEIAIVSERNVDGD